MKTLANRALVLMVVLCGLPMPTRAIESEVFDLPEGHAGESYQTDIEAVLRDNYRLKIESGVRESILQWALVEGDLPPGLAVSTDGKVTGKPSTYNDQPYFFRVKVTDMAVTGADTLIVPLRLSIRPARLRLTKTNGLTLTPISEAGTAAPNHTTATAIDERLATGPRAAELGSSTVFAAETSRNASSSSSSATPSIPVSANYYNSSGNPMLSARRPSGRNVISKIVGLLGSGHQDRGAAAADNRSDCDSAPNKVTSDEAHTPLTKDTSTQNTCVEFVNLNTLKYRYEFNEEKTTSAGPDISSLPFLPKVSLTAVTATTAPTDPLPPALSPPTRALIQAAADPKEAEKGAVKKLVDEIALLSKKFVAVRKNLTELETDLRNSVEKKINDNTSAVQEAHGTAKGLANGADLYLQSNDSNHLLDEVKTVKENVDRAMLTQWPSEDISTVLRNLDEVTSQLEDLRVNGDGSLISHDAWKEWLAANEGRYNRVRDRIPELRTKVSTITGGEAAFNESKVILAAWKLVIDNVNSRQAAAFKQEAFVTCHNDEGENQSSKLTLTKTDRTASSQTATSREVLTVNCYSRVAITAGFNFSTLDEKEFSVVQSAGETPGTVVKKFGFTNKSSFRPNPLALMNVRFTDNPVYNWHASFGAVVDLKGQTGTDVEPVAGVSFSIRRLIFITPFAVHFGRVTRLAGDFKVGDVVPDAVATPPVEKAWKVGYTTGVTFRIAP